MASTKGWHFIIDLKITYNKKYIFYHKILWFYHKISYEISSKYSFFKLFYSTSIIILDSNTLFYSNVFFNKSSLSPLLEPFFLLDSNNYSQ